MNSSDPKRATQPGIETAERPPMTIEVFFDFICPWCLIGKRNMDAAVRRFAGLRPDVPLAVLWRSHQLLPDTPLNGKDYQAFYLDRLGSPEAVAARRAQVQRAGYHAGVEFAFDRIGVLPNTAAAHQLVAYAASRGSEAQLASLIDRMFTAYFMEGENIGEPRILEQLGLECGLDYAGLTDHLAESGRHMLHSSHRVNGVPHFVFNAGYALSGAHSPDAIFEAMVLAVRD
ncbi:putative DsbA family dithiol-disulfide isomerase [Paraburkholderia sp. MM5496-R1]|uniref:Predicted dithiol-disulfide isomerase, DsbA family n=2 Tax=Paraburkholderia TaxID=1822464 RepID=A0A1H1KDC5_9BURK|nr:DsbA family oxidoreductase [Paraburkholderia tuberum]SDR60072.1 Predicted dithiol-disulfide isomerase, DsbA family [Paraburkholderia tuberum]